MRFLERFIGSNPEERFVDAQGNDFRANLVTPEMAKRGDSFLIKGLRDDPTAEVTGYVEGTWLTNSHTYSWLDIKLQTGSGFDSTNYLTITKGNEEDDWSKLGYALYTRPLDLYSVGLYTYSQVPAKLHYKTETYAQVDAGIATTRRWDDFSQAKALVQKPTDVYFADYKSQVSDKLIGIKVNNGTGENMIVGEVEIWGGVPIDESAITLLPAGVIKKREGALTGRKYRTTWGDRRRAARDRVEEIKKFSE